MNRLIFLLVGLVAGLTVTQVRAATDNQLTTDTDKQSYVIGLDIGKSFKNQDVVVNPNQLLKGFSDGRTGAKPLLTDAEQQQIMLQLKKQMMAKQQQKIEQQATANGNASVAFLAANAKKPGVKETKSGLQYKILTAGKGVAPTATDAVTVNYEGKLLDGTVFDSSYKRGQPATFKVNQVIAGWTEALKLMKPGSTWMLWIPAGLAYGKTGAGSSIPPNSMLEFKVNLISVKKA